MKYQALFAASRLPARSLAPVVTSALYLVFFAQLTVPSGLTVAVRGIGDRTHAEGVAVSVAVVGENGHGLGGETTISLPARLLEEDAFYSGEYQRSYPEEPLKE